MCAVAIAPGVKICQTTSAELHCSLAIFKQPSNMTAICMLQAVKVLQAFALCGVGTINVHGCAEQFYAQQAKACA